MCRTLLSMLRVLIFTPSLNLTDKKTKVKRTMSFSCIFNYYFVFDRVYCIRFVCSLLTWSLLAIWLLLSPRHTTRTMLVFAEIGSVLESLFCFPKSDFYGFIFTILSTIFRYGVAQANEIKFYFIPHECSDPDPHTC